MSNSKVTQSLVVTRMNWTLSILAATVVRGKQM